MLIDFQYLANKYRFRPEGVLHIGASEGQEANAYHNLKVKRVVWIEALDSVYIKLVKNIRKYPGQETILACVSDVHGEEVDFHVTNNGAQSSSMLELGTHSQVHPEIKVDYTIQRVTSRIDQMDYDWSGLDFLNIDIQGAELMALKGMGKMLDQFNFAYLEINEKELYRGCVLFPELNNFMKSKGFIFKELKWCGNTYWGDGFWMK